MNTKLLMLSILFVLPYTSLRAECVQPPSGLQAWWSGDSHSNDISGNGNHGTAHNITYDTALVSEGFKLNGTNSYVSVSESSSLTVTNITFDAWINPLNLEWQPIVEYGEANEYAGVHFWVGAGNGVPSAASLLVNFRDASGLNHALQVDDVIPTNEWSFVAATYDRSTGVGKMYLNGTLIANVNLGSFTLKTDKQVAIGRRDPNSFDAGAGSYFHGMIDELEVFNRALSATELQDIYNAGAAGKCKECVSAPSGLNGWWSGDSHSNDISGNGNNGTAHNMTYGSAMVAEGFILNGTNAYVSIPESSNLTVTNITIDAWIYPHNLEWQPIVEYGEASEYAGVHFWVGAGNGAPSSASLLVNFRDSGGFNHALQVDDIIPIDTWSFVAATYNKTTGLACMYLNGALVASNNFGSLVLRTDKRLEIGHRDAASLDAGADSYFHGTIDEVEIFNRPLSATELQTIYEARAAGKCK